MKILNLTQHAATADQLAAGVVDLPSDLLPIVKEVLTFNRAPSRTELDDRAACLADIASRVPGVESVMIGGAPFFMAALENRLGAFFRVGYAFSERVSEDQVQADGSVRKVAVFRHVGFVWVN